MSKSRRTYLFLFLFTAGLIAVVVSPLQAAPEKTESATIEEANELFKAKEWSEAAKAYESITGHDPSNGQAWLRLGRSRHNLKMYAEAAAAYRRAEKLDFTPPTTRYNLARVHARMGDEDKAFNWLDRALEAGFGSPGLIESDADLASLKKDSRFEQVLAQANKIAFPCRHEEVYRQFDFWVGAWDVRTPQGQTAGSNSIQESLDGCLLIENWEGAAGSSGKSMNYYDPQTKKWTQIWVDSGGGVIHAVGSFRDGAMRFEGKHFTLKGTELYKMSFTPLPDGHVRQLIEQSNDDGESWYIWFDGDYAPKG